MVSERPDWDTYFLGIARAVAARADCTRRKVGAVLVDEEHRIVACGYNGGPSGGPSCLAGECPRGRLDYEQQPAFTGYDNCIAVHAETNALLYAGNRARGCVLYLTDPPCGGCQKLIKQAGIERVVCE